MEFAQNIISASEIEWLKANAWLITLTTLVFIQWVVIQGLLLHYYYFRKNLKQPRPDGIRLNLAERSIALQSEQLEKIFAKLAALNREIDILADRSARLATKQGSVQVTGPSLEASVATMGELNLRKRLQEIQAN